MMEVTTPTPTTPSQVFERISSKYGYDHGTPGPGPGQDQNNYAY